MLHWSVDEVNHTHTHTHTHTHAYTHTYTHTHILYTHQRCGVWHESQIWFLETRLDRKSNNLRLDLDLDPQDLGLDFDLRLMTWNDLARFCHSFCGTDSPWTTVHAAWDRIETVWQLQKTNWLVKHTLSPLNRPAHCKSTQVRRSNIVRRFWRVMRVKLNGKNKNEFMHILIGYI
jgi:hypothetical protein